jgi:hypothetical protein
MRGLSGLGDDTHKDEVRVIVANTLGEARTLISYERGPPGQTARSQQLCYATQSTFTKVTTCGILLNFFRHSGNYTYHLVLQSITLHFAHRAYLWVSYDSQNKKLFFSPK